MSDTSQGPGWWQASDDRWYPPDSHPNYRPPPPAPSMIEDRPASRHAWWLVVIGMVFAAFSIARLFLDLSATALGTSVSCGNVVNWLSNNPHPPSPLESVCGAQLHNATVEGIVAAIVGLALLIAWLCVVQAWWPLVIFTAFLIFVATALGGYPLMGCIWAGALVVIFGVWRGFRDRSVNGRYRERS